MNVVSQVENLGRSNDLTQPAYRAVFTPIKQHNHRPSRADFLCLKSLGKALPIQASMNQ
jgi:hypothetical protein